MDCLIKPSAVAEVDIFPKTQSNIETSEFQKNALCRVKSKLMEWEIKEWTTELRENDISMDEQNQKRKVEKMQSIEEIEKVERAKREKALIEKENMLSVLKFKLEAKERDIEGKSAVLNIAIKSNEI